jgi:two-component system, chemotaxis family, sensor kinase CheA
MMEQHIAAYREEAIELLTELESSLLELEETPDDKDLISRVFRAMHTIKGSGAMFGFDDIARFTHEVETVFDLVRNGKMAVTKELLNLTLQSRDHISALLDASSGMGEADHGRGEEIIAGLRNLEKGGGAAPPPKSPAQPLGPPPDSGGPAAMEKTVTWRIRFEPNRELLLCGSKPLSLLNELRDLGTCQISAHFQQVPTLDNLVPEHCYLYWDVVLTTSRGEAAIRDVFIFVEDDCRITIKQIDDVDSDREPKKLGEILVDRGDLAPEQLQTVLAQQKPLGELLVASGVVSDEKVRSALAEQQQIKAVRQERAAPEGAASIRVPAEKLDQLVNLVGEMVTVQARLSQVAGQTGDSRFVAIAEEVERLTNELRNTALNIRMLPIGSTFSKFKRLVRDLSIELGKEIEMETFGADTELDKTVIEKLNDPLVHIIRNSIDHGIEKPEKRLAAGKPRTGTIRLGAEHAGDSVLITIYDDGGGINREAIHKKAIELGMVSPNLDLSDQEVFSYIFAPGFSMAATITSVSGRGVGMDVVKRGIEGLRGTIVVDSTLGVGTTITLKIPLTLAIIESLLVKIGDSHYVLPLTSVEECVELSRQDVENAHGRNLANVRGHLTPYISLRQQFGIGGERPEIEQIVIVGVKGGRIGFVVDAVVGEHQTVIKPLGAFYHDVVGISGATILGDGSVALILAPGDLAAMAESFEQRALTAHG